MLGLRIGRNVGSAEVFAKAALKLRDRLALFKPILKRLTPNKRFHVYNIFCHPLLTYLSQVCSIPNTGPASWQVLRRMAARAILPFGGTAIKFDNAITPTCRTSLPTPLRDPWASSVACLAAMGDFAIHDGATSIRQSSDTMRFSGMVAANTADAVYWWLYLHNSEGDPPAVFKADVYQGLTPAKRRGVIYRDLVLASNKESATDSKLRKWLGKRGLQGSQEHVDRLHRHFAGFQRLKSNVRLHQFLLPLNAVATDERTRFITGRAKGASRCYLCKSGPDHIDHIHGVCKVALSARAKFGRLIGYDLDHGALNAPSPLAAAHLLFDPAKCPQAHAIAIINWAAWCAARKHFAGSGQHTRSTRTRIIVEMAMSSWAQTRKRSWNDPAQAHSTGVKEGNARPDAQAIISKATEQRAILAFSGGTAMGNPGHAGAGAIVVFPATANRGGFTVEASAALGVRDNDYAELWGNGMVFGIVQKHCPAPTDALTLVQCTSSAWSIDVITYKTAPGRLRPLGHAVRRLANQVNDLIPTTACWVKGHTAHLRDQVQLVAKAAAVRSRNGQSLVDLEARNKNANFIPPQCTITPHVDNYFAGD